MVGSRSMRHAWSTAVVAACSVSRRWRAPPLVPPRDLRRVGAGEGFGSGTGRERVAMAHRAPVRRPYPRQARRRPRAAGRWPQPTLDPAPARHDLPHRRTAGRRREAGRPVPGAVAEPPDQARRLQAVPVRATGRGLHERLETSGKRSRRTATPAATEPSVPTSSRFARAHRRPVLRPHAQSPDGSSLIPTPCRRAST